MMTTEMTDLEFEERYRPIDHTTLGSESEDWCDWEHLKGVASERIWTVVEADGTAVISAGLACVNRLYYVVTEKPWATMMENAIWWDADDFEEDE